MLILIPLLVLSVTTIILITQIQPHEKNSAEVNSIAIPSVHVVYPTISSVSKSIQLVSNVKNYVTKQTNQPIQYDKNNLQNVQPSTNLILGLIDKYGTISSVTNTDANIVQYAYAATDQVTISNGASVTSGTCTSTSCFNPQVLDINVGDTVTWTNDDSVGHTATSGNPSDSQTGTVFDSSLIRAGGSYTSPAFTTAGTYNYFCQVHPWMTGKIIVGTLTQPTITVTSVHTAGPNNIGISTKDTSGNILTVYSSYQVARYVPSTKTQTIWTIPNNEQVCGGGFFITADSSGNAYFPLSISGSNTGNPPLERLNPSTNVFTEWDGLGMGGCEQFAFFDSSNNLYLSSPQTGFMEALNPSTNTLTKWSLNPSSSNPVSGYGSMIIDSTNTIYFTNEDSGNTARIYKFVPSTNSITSWPASTSNDLAVDSSGNVFFFENGADNANKIGELSTSTNTITEWTIPFTTSQGQTPITVDSADNVFFVNGGTLFRLVPSTNTFTQWSTSLNSDNITFFNSSSLGTLDFAGYSSGTAAYSIFSGTPVTFKDPTQIKNAAYGSWVSSSGNDLLISCPGITGSTTVSTVCLYDANSNNLLKTLQDPNPVTNDGFGINSISGNNILTSSPNVSPGVAYLFDATSGNLLHTFQNPNSANGNSFGYSVSVSGNNVVIGDPFLQHGPPNGAVYLFDATTGNLLHTFTNLTPTNADFGIAVFVTGNNILVGSDNGDVVYLFDASTGNTLKTFQNPNPGSNNWFGESLSMDGNNVVIGAPHSTVNGKNNAGSVYLFDATTGNLLQTLQDLNPTSDDLFGWSVSISGGTLAIGSIKEGTTQNNAGSVYIYDITSGSLLQTLQASSPTSHDRFGWRVSLSGNNLLVGSPYYPTNNPSNSISASGAAFLYNPN